MSSFINHRDIFRKYVNKGVIVGFRMFDEPHGRNCSAYKYSNVTVSPADMDQVYKYVSNNFGSVPVGSTTPPCCIGRTSYGNLAFAQYRWAPTVSAEGYFSSYALESKNSGLFFVISLNSNTSNAVTFLMHLKPYVTWMALVSSLRGSGQALANIRIRVLRTG